MCPMEELKPVFYKDRGEWRRWLADNGTTAREIWLPHYKKSAGKISLNHGDAVEEDLAFGWIDGKLKRIDQE
jgi:uncharacterized protein YdeI (YjbR/CyaY-like superfamily)